ncbi:MAG: VCBS repeat-containing protein [Phycisphaerae bacterium]|nr:VCBS repeat-containing protein [Phycisphaerae bacterium]
MASLALALTCLLAALGADEQKLTEAQKNALPQYFGFGPFQIYKIKPGIGPLRLADLDVDGRTDIVVWNGYQRRIELFYQPDPNAPADETQPDLERNEVPNRGNMRAENVPVTYSVATLEVAELTGDDRPDIVFFGEPKELVILPGKEGGGFGPADGRRAPEGLPRHGSLCVGDFNHDGRADVALLGDELLLIFHQKEAGGLAQPLRLVHGIKSPTLMLRTDMNGDGRADLLIGAADDRHGAYVCLQEASGTLAALRPIKIPHLRSMTITNAVGGKGGDDLYAIEYNTNRLKHFRWEMPRAARAAADWPMRLHSYPVKSKSKRRPLAVGDVNGDGLVDCVTADPDAAQIILFKGEPTGLGAGTAYPGLIKTTDVCIADVDLDGRREVLIVSAEEKMIGVSRYENGRLTFPTEIPARGEPFVVAVGSLKVGAAADHLAYVTREDEEFSLVLRAIDAADEETYAIDELEDNPAGLRFVDVNQDGLSDLLLFVRYSSPHTFLQTADGQFESLDEAEARTGLLKDASPAGFAMADVTGDGRPEVLLAQDNLARALVVREQRWTVVDQYNPETADAKISGLAALPGQAGSPTIVMYERRADDLLVLKRRQDNAYGVVQSMPVGSFDLTAMQPLPIGTAGQVAVLMADTSKLAVLTPNEKAPTLVEQHSYETKTKDAVLGDAVIGDLNHDGVRDVAVVDMGKAAIEVLTTPPGGGFVKALRFQVFQGKRFHDAPDVFGEPREVLIGDVTDDGIDDLVLIVHDRLIVYPAQ